MNVQNSIPVPTAPIVANSPMIGTVIGAALAPEISWVTKYVTFFKAHERLLIVLAVLAFGLHGYSKYLDSAASKKDAQMAALTQTLDQSKAQAALAASQSDMAAAAFQKALTTVQAANQALAASSVQKQAVLVKQQAADQSQPLPDVVDRWRTLLTLQPNDLAPSVDGSAVSVSNSGVRTTVSSLESVPVLTNELVDARQISANDSNLLTQQAGLTIALQSQVSALNVELADQSKQCVAQVALEKVKTKRAFIRGFKWGAVTGFIGGLFLGHAV